MSQTRRSAFSHWKRHGLLALMLLALALMFTSPAGPVVWATPLQSPLRQTIPTITPTPIPTWIWVGGLGMGPVDYAPRGMPDFDQKQDAWYAPALTEVWTHCGAVALADALWWLDSWAEPGSTAPPEVSSGHALIDPFGPWDDHDARNVAPLVEDWATRLGTNAPAVSTEVSVFIPAIEAYVAEKELSGYAVTLIPSPSFEQLEASVRRGDAVVLLLGFWEEQGVEQWAYLGGHYVAVAGVEPANRLVAISDPYRDALEAGETALGRSWAVHPFPHAADVHNDTQYVSHDAYRLVAAQGPGGIWALADYIRDDAHLTNFLGQNQAAGFAPYYGSYAGPFANVLTRLDYAVALSGKPTRYTMYLPIILKRSR